MANELVHNATYKGRRLYDMEREELLEVIANQVMEFRKVSHLIDWNKWLQEKREAPSLELPLV